MSGVRLETILYVAMILGCCCTGSEADTRDEWCDPNSPYGNASTGQTLVVESGTVYRMEHGDEAWQTVWVKLNAMLDTQGYVLRVCGTLTNEGVITDTRCGGAGGAGGTHGTGGNPKLHTDIPQCAKVAGCTLGAVGESGTPGCASGAGQGGHGGGGGCGGGGAWWGLGNIDADGGNGGDGGDGGKGGGIVTVYAYEIYNTGVIQADGEAGQVGQAGPAGYANCGAEYYKWECPLTCKDLAGGGGGGGAGGNGGNGGTVNVFHCLGDAGTVSPSGSVHANQGALGTGGAGGSVAIDELDYGVAVGGFQDGCLYAGGGGQGGNGCRTAGQSPSPGQPGLNGSAGLPGQAHVTSSYCYNDSGIMIDWSPIQIVPGNEIAFRCTAWNCRPWDATNRRVWLTRGTCDPNDPNELTSTRIDIPAGGTTEVTLFADTSGLAVGTIPFQAHLEAYTDESDQANNHECTMVAALPKTQAQTLIFTSRAQMIDQYTDAAWQPLRYDLVRFSTDPYIVGVVVDVDASPAVVAAFGQWHSTPADQTRANDVVEAIDAYVQTLLNTQYTNAKYLVALGKDETVPFYRMPAGLWDPESEYPHLDAPGCETTVRHALAANMLLTDSYYADAENEDPPVPDYAIGRLIETPDQIRAQLEAFMQTGPLISLHDVGIIADNAAYAEDEGIREYDLFEESFPAAGIQALLGLAITTDGVIDMLTDSPSKGFLSLHAHASHRAVGRPPQPYDWYVVADPNNVGNGVQGSLISSTGCHAGLNVGDSADCHLDWPELFMSSGARGIVGSTTVTFPGLLDWLPMWHEVVADRLARNLCDGMSIGDALMEAKTYYRRRFCWIDTPGGAQRRALLSPTLYGIPHYQYETSQKDRASRRAEEPAEPIMSTRSFRDGQRIIKDTYVFGTGTFVEHPDGQGGSHYLSPSNLAGYGIGTPIIPLEQRGIASRDGLTVHGAVLVDEEHHDVMTRLTLGTVCSLQDDEDFGDCETDAFLSANWYPEVDNQVNVFVGGGESAETIVFAVGGYHQPCHTVRLYDKVVYEVYRSDSSDWVPPTLGGVSHAPQTPSDGQTVTIYVVAVDASDIERVMIRYSANAGDTWQNADAIPHPVIPSVWYYELTLPHYGCAIYYVNVVDVAGNVTTDKNGGNLYALGSAPSFCAGDLNGSGLVNGRDIQDFVNCALGYESSPCICASGDFNGDGAVTEADLSDFIQVMLFGPWGRSCESNADCTCSEACYCHKDSCDDLIGECQCSPEVCPSVSAPVCGCDGITYGNACEAAMAGVNVRHAGACP